MSADRVALNLRLPTSLHQGLVEVAKREYRSLNDQIVYFLARAVLDQLDPQRDDWFHIVSHAAKRLEPYLNLWQTRYPDQPPPPVEPHEPVLVVRAYPEDRAGADFGFQWAEATPEQRARIAAQDRLERACAELVRAFQAWEHANALSRATTRADD